MSWNRLKFVAIAFVFFILGLFAIPFIWFIIESLFLQNEDSKYSEYILFMLGYGDAQAEIAPLKVAISICGIIMLSLFTSVLTVSLLEMRKRVKVYDKIIVCHDSSVKYLGSKNFGIILLHNKHSDIYKLRICLQLTTSKATLQHEYSVPYVSKGEVYAVRSDLDAGSIIFSHLQDKVEAKTLEPSLIILTVEYTDSRNLQEYVLCQKYEYGKYVMSGKSPNLGDAPVLRIGSKKKAEGLLKLSEDPLYDDEIKKMILNPGYEINLADAQKINEDYLTITCTKSQINQSDILHAEIHFPTKTTKKQDVFAMAVVNAPLGGEWQKYYDIGCYLSFTIHKPEGLVVTLEIKGASGPPIVTHKFDFDKPSKQYELELAKLPRENWSFIRELCFTVFLKDCKTNKGEFTIMDCKLIRKNKTDIEMNDV